MDTNPFMDKSPQPDVESLSVALKVSYALWRKINDFVLEQYPTALAEWNYSGVKYGWSYRIKDKKRAIIYLLPRDGFFKVAFVFGQKAYEQILASSVSDEIKKELSEARVYAEGRGIRLDVTEANLEEIFSLVKFKLMF
jgi:hypothetical protein